MNSTCTGPELENRAGVRPSTQRAVEAKLRDLGMLQVAENRREYDRNDANSYQLKGVLRIKNPYISYIGTADVAKADAWTAPSHHPRTQGQGGLPTEGQAAEADQPRRRGRPRKLDDSP